MNSENIRKTLRKVPTVVFCYRFTYRIYKEFVLFIKLIKFHIKKPLINHQESLSRQHIRILYKVDGLYNQSTSMVQFFNQKKVKFKVGSYVYYIPPQDNLWLNKVLAHYPEDAALKILKTSGKADDRIYVRSLKKPIFQKMLFPNSYEMLCSCNYLNAYKITPRIYDLTYLVLGDTTFTTFIVKNIDGCTPGYEECINFLDRVRGMIDKKLLSIISVKPWYKTTDFSCPHCSGNLLVDDKNDIFYVDFQNFVVDGNKALKEELEFARSQSHFGSKYFVRKGAYLYQSIPRFSKYGKRDTEKRWRVIKNMLQENNLTLHKKVIFDVGCNIGMIIANCLSNGVFWCIGWDKPDLIPHADKILSLLGYSRYNLYAANLHGNYKFYDDIPAHLQSWSDDAFLFFLSMRAHIGFPKHLFKIPWKYMVYEDHQKEERNIDKYLAKIKKIINVRVLSRISIVDGDCSHRPLVLLEKLHADGYSLDKSLY